MSLFVLVQRYLPYNSFFQLPVLGDLILIRLFLVRLQLGEDNAKGVSNCGADTSTSDANDDALNSSSSDDNDAKAKKKNRCALCRKKVGLTGEQNVRAYDEYQKRKALYNIGL